MSYKTLQDKAISEKWLEKIQHKDVSLWADDNEVQQKISQRLGWLDSIDWLEAALDDIYAVKQALSDEGVNHVVLLGMGGSSLAPEVCRVIKENLTNHQSKATDNSQSENSHDAFTFQMLDDTAPASVRNVLDSISLKHTVFIVASKSGSTLETDSFFRYFYSQYDESEAGRHFIAITDADTQMSKTADQLKFFHSFINPSDIGGRFSALSYFGFVPAIFMSIPVEQMLAGAKQEYDEVFQSQKDMPELLRVALQMGAWANAGRNKCFLSFADEIQIMELWIDQLIAESTGKDGKGILPVPAPKTFQLTDDAFSVNIDFNATPSKAIMKMNDVNHTISWAISSWHDIGRDFLRWEIMTAILGVVLNINPFDEPDVTVAKEKTKEILNNADNALILNQYKICSYDSLQEQLNICINEWQQPYISIAIYGDNKQKAEHVLQDLRDKFHQRYQVPVVINTGPRYLHSSGQLHKGGPSQGIFIIVTLGYQDDEKIPGQSFSFAELNRAQVLGDMSALNDRDRPILWLDLADKEDGLKSWCL